MIDYTRLQEKLNPKVDGEDKLRLRTGTVDTVNADGTLDIEMSDGEILPNINKLATAYAPVGAVVQIIVFRGAMLVIGAVGSNAANGAMTKTGSTTGGPTAATSWTSATIPFGVTFPNPPSVHVNLDTGTGNAASWVGRARAISTTGFTILAYGPSNTFSELWRWTAVYAP